ncbi:MAG TPA: ammonium transporter [Pirellulales bacterium]|nr:ammonium transporter [Pirellulales bacterium]
MKYPILMISASILFAVAFAWPLASAAEEAQATGGVAAIADTTASAPVAPAEVLPPKEVVAGGETGDETTVAPKHQLDRGDNAWMLVSSALVLCMTTPGLAMFYGGLVRRKNILSVVMQCLFLMGLMTAIWGVVGYSLSFGGTGAWLGNTDYLFMRGVQATWTSEGPVTPLHGTLNIPMLTHMLFQGMFFIITPALICGAFAERMKFSAMVVFSILWGLVVYCPLCHWVWGGGVLAYGSPHAELFCAGGALDFAGGTVVHISSGVSALVCALVLGKRAGYGHEPMPPHNLTYTALGAGLLWVGWFGFNAGSALAADSIAASAFAATHFSAAAGAVAWPVAEWLRAGKPTVLGASSGAVAGLVCVTPAAGFVTPMSALIMGAAAGLMCYFTCSVMKQKLGYDDSLDAFGVHGLGGTLGAILTGVFATRAVFDISTKGTPLGLLEGGNVLVAQIIATLISWALAAAATFVLLKLIDGAMGLRVTSEQEIEGLDISLHGEEGYIFS